MACVIKNTPRNGSKVGFVTPYAWAAAVGVGVRVLGGVSVTLGMWVSARLWVGSGWGGVCTKIGRRVFCCCERP